jgi:hypothetical protein
MTTASDDTLRPSAASISRLQLERAERIRMPVECRLARREPHRGEPRPAGAAPAKTRYVEPLRRRRTPKLPREIAAHDLVGASRVDDAAPLE